MFVACEEEVPSPFLDFTLQESLDEPLPLTGRFIFLKDLVLLPVNLQHTDFHLGHVILQIVADVLDQASYH